MSLEAGLGLEAAGLQAEVDGQVATLSLARPAVLNAQHPAMWAGIVRFIDSLGPEVRVVVLRGVGGVFSAGLDLSLVDPAQVDQPDSLLETARLDDTGFADAIGEYRRAFTAFTDPRFISIAVVEGAAVGAGFQMALACDLRIASTDAWFCMKEPALGLVPDLVGTKPLVEAIGYARALEICASARRVGAEEASRIGLVQAVAPSDELGAALEVLIGALTAHPVDAVRATKSLLQAAPGRTLDEQRRAEREAQVPRFRAVLPTP